MSTLSKTFSNLTVGAVFAACATLAVSACKKEPQVATAAENNPTVSAEARPPVMGTAGVVPENGYPPVDTERAILVNEGKSIYLTRCIACHNTNPKVAGSLGPDIYGSTKELITARVLTATYPTGYTPKRNTKMMVAMPDLKDKLEAIYTFLNE